MNRTAGYSTALPARRPRAAARFALAATLAGAMFAAPSALHAQASVAPQAGQAAPSATYVPESGQPGKDVVWVPTPQAVVDRMLDMAKVTPQDYLIDLGSGDGRTVITAAQRGLTAHGIEYNPDMVALAQRNAAAAGVSDRATFVQADLFESTLPKAQVITLFLLPELNERLRPQILDYEPGTRVVSNTFPMGDWEPDQTSRIDGCTQWCTALMWIVPAKVAGSWRLGEQELKLEQTYQMLAGTLGSAPIQNGRLNGREISFTVGGVQYIGTVTEGGMSGSASGGTSPSWTATKS